VITNKGSCQVCELAQIPCVRSGLDGRRRQQRSLDKEARELLERIRTLPEEESKKLYQTIRRGHAERPDDQYRPAIGLDITINAASPAPNLKKEYPMAPGAVTSFGNLPMSSAIKANGYPPGVQLQQLKVFTISEAYIQPLNIEQVQSDHLASSMLSFRSLARSQLARNVPADQVLSMKGLDLALFFRDRRAEDPHNVSTWSCEFIKAWQFLAPVTQLAAIHLVGSFMRWYILPCAETYALMSPLMRPLKGQIAVPHPASTGLVHLPMIRQALLEGGKSWVNRVTVDTQHFHWNLGSEAAIKEAALEPGLPAVCTLRREFTDSCDNFSNWTLHESILQDYPEISLGGMGLHSDEVDPARYEP
jgi:hypothetical protein